MLMRKVAWTAAGTASLDPLARRSSAGSFRSRGVSPVSCRAPALPRCACVAWPGSPRRHAARCRWVRGGI